MSPVSSCLSNCSILRLVPKLYPTYPEHWNTLPILHVLRLLASQRSKVRYLLLRASAIVFSINREYCFHFPKSFWKIFFEFFFESLLKYTLVFFNQFLYDDYSPISRPSVSQQGGEYWALGDSRQGRNRSASPPLVLHRFRLLPWLHPSRSLPSQPPSPAQHSWVSCPPNTPASCSSPSNSIFAVTESSPTTSASNHQPSTSWRSELSKA